MKTQELQLSYKALKESQTRFRMLFEGSPDAIFLAAPDGTIWAANPAACAMFGCAERELRALGRSGILDVNDPRYGPAMEERQRIGTIQGRELTAIRKNGEKFPVEVDSVIIQSQPAQSFWVLRDITERKRREATLALLADLAGEFARLSSADEIMKIVGAKVGAHLGISNCLFAEIDEKRDLATVQYSWQRTPDTPDVIGNHRLSTFVSPEFVQAVRSGEPVVIRNTQTDPRTNAASFAAFGIYAYVTVPFFRGDEWKYALTVNDSVPREWREDEIEFIHEITSRTFPRLERARAEEALRESEERLSFALDTSHTGAWDLDLATHVAHRSLEHARIFGYELPAPEWTFEKFLEHVLPEDREEVTRRFHAAVQEGCDLNYECRIRRVDGEVRWIWVAGRSRDAGGVARRMTGFVQDITERKNALNAIKASAAKYRRIVQTAQEGIWIIDGDDRTIFLNQKVADLLGYTIQEVLGRSPRDFMAPEFKERSAGRLQDQMKGSNRLMDYRFLRKDGSDLWCILSSNAWVDESGQIAGSLAMITDITERRRTEESLRKSEARFRLLAQTSEKLLKSPDPQSAVNELCVEAMKFLDCQAFFNYLVDEGTGGLRLNACAGIPEHAVRKIEKLDYGVAVCGCVAQSGERIIAEDLSHSTDPRTDLVRAQGIQAYCCHPLKTHDRLIGTLSFGTRTRVRFTELEIEVMRTIADHVAVAIQRMQAESSLRELNATLEKRVEDRTAEITAMASQLRELASALTMTEQRERQRLAKVLHDHIQQMLVAAKLQTGILVNRQSNENLAASARLVNDLLDQTLSASRTLTAELSPAILYDGGLGPALQWLSRSFLEKHGLKVDVVFDSSGEPELEDVRVFMFDAVREILFNVVKHSGAEKARVEGFCEKDGRICLTVIDRGRGFDPTRLQSGRKTGGFGLFSIQQRLGHMGGQLEVVSAPGRGTRVSLVGPPHLKAEQQPYPEARRKEADGPSDKLTMSGKIRIVLADDHHIIRQGLASLLRMEPDIEIVGEASDGSQAIALAHSLCPDVVIMDISMPGTNGIDATREIRRDRPHVQVIGLSMHEEGELSTAILDAGAVAYVTKGGPSESLVAAIHKAVESRTGTPFGIM